MSAYPTKRSRLGNAVGLDTPASVIELLHALRDAGLPGRPHPRRRRRPHGRAGRPLHLREPHAHPRPGRAGRRPPRRPPTTTAWFAARPPAPDEVDVDLGRPPGEVYVVPPPTRLPRRSVDAATGRGGTSCSPGSTSAACWSPSSRRGGSAPTPSAPTTPPTCPRPTTTWPSTAGSTPGGAPTPWSTSASTARSSGCPARPTPCRPPATPTPPSATCRSSTRSWSTTPARARRPSGAPTP